MINEKILFCFYCFIDIDIFSHVKNDLYIYRGEIEIYNKLNKVLKVYLKINQNRILTKNN